MMTWEIAATHNLESDKLSFQGRFPIEPSTSNSSFIPDSHDPDFPMGEANNTNCRKNCLSSQYDYLFDLYNN